MWELAALKKLARNDTVPGVALRDVISELERTQAALNAAHEAITVSDRIKDRLCDLVGAPGNPMEAINLLVYRSGVCEWTHVPATHAKWRHIKTSCGDEFDGDEVSAKFCSVCGRKIQVNGASSPEGGDT